MKDVFISHSSHDRLLTEEVCSEIEKQHIGCWVSYRYTDMLPGDNYTTQITEAIDHCSIFIILLSRDSIASGQVQQELVLANERQRYGLRILPVILDPSLEMDTIHRNCGYVLAGKEYAFWYDESSRKALLQRIKTILGEATACDEAAVVQSVFPKIERLIGREAEIQLITHELENCHRLLITGVGGIGKTATLQAFCNSEAGMKYKTIVYLSFDECLLRTIDDDSAFPIQSQFLQEKRKEVSDYEYALMKLSIFEKSADQSTLLIIDNFETDSDPLFDRICKIKCDMIIARRFVPTNLPGFRRIEIGRITDKDSLRSLFEEYYGSALEDSEAKAFQTICESVHGHTMSLIMIAKQMRYFGKKPSDYKNQSEIQNERINNLSHIIAGNNPDSELIKTYDSISKVIDGTTLTETERCIMKTLCLLPIEGLQKNVCLSLIGNQYADELQKLEKLGWLQSDVSSMKLYVHPLIEDVLLSTYPLHLEDPDIQPFLKNFIQAITDCWNAPYAENIKYKQLAISIYFTFPSPTIQRYREYITLSRFLWVINGTELGLEIQNKVKNLFRDMPNSPEEAEASLQIGFQYHSKGDYQRAEQELYQAAQIYGNKFAAAISHLAQAKMMQEGAVLADIEPLLQQSLAIRQTYWPDTRSEANSCHLYAKVLSNFGEKLEDALLLEKKAYKLFSKIEGTGSNVSSAAYMLGWLYVQTADDQEDIQQGIEKLEEAKSIRIHVRGDPLHPWMEDIYLKLGLAYKALGNIEEARRYHDLLLQVCKRKYANDPDDMRIIEAYRLLLEECTLLHDEDRAKECRKYLKYHS